MIFSKLIFIHRIVFIINVKYKPQVIMITYLFTWVNNQKNTVRFDPYIKDWIHRVFYSFSSISSCIYNDIRLVFNNVRISFPVSYLFYACLFKVSVDKDHHLYMHGLLRLSYCPFNGFSLEVIYNWWSTKSNVDKSYIFIMVYISI